MQESCPHPPSIYSAGASRFALALLLLPGSWSHAANHFVRAGASGAGVDWARAYGQLPATLMRDDTYYVAAGQYPAYSFNTPGSGLTTIKKATVADHGTVTGWNAAYATGYATFVTLMVERHRRGEQRRHRHAVGQPGLALRLRYEWREARQQRQLESRRGSIQRPIQCVLAVAIHFVPRPRAFVHPHDLLYELILTSPSSRMLGGPGQTLARRGAGCGHLADGDWLTTHAFSTTVHRLG
jgi:hypothetical protein